MQHRVHLRMVGRLTGKWLLPHLRYKMSITTFSVIQKCGYVGEITCSRTLYNSVPYFSSHAHFSTAIDAWSLANSINPEHLLEDEMKS
jgi:hypothetical protein